MEIKMEEHVPDREHAKQEQKRRQVPLLSMSAIK